MSFFERLLEELGAAQSKAEAKQLLDAALAHVEPTDLNESEEFVARATDLIHEKFPDKPAAPRNAGSEFTPNCARRKDLQNDNSEPR
jgi:hypothetical protein